MILLISGSRGMNHTCESSVQACVCWPSISSDGRTQYHHSNAHVDILPPSPFLEAQSCYTPHPASWHPSAGNKHEPCNSLTVCIQSMLRRTQGMSEQYGLSWVMIQHTLQKNQPIKQVMKHVRQKLWTLWWSMTRVGNLWHKVWGEIVRSHLVKSNVHVLCVLTVCVSRSLCHHNQNLCNQSTSMPEATPSSSSLPGW